MKKAKTFTSFEGFDEWADRFEECSDWTMVPTVVDDGWKIMIDIETQCKSWKTAMRRFEKAFIGAVDKNADFDCWVEAMTESCENGYFKDYFDDRSCIDETTDLSDYSYGFYSWGVEQLDDGYWYVFLNIAGGYAGR